LKHRGNKGGYSYWVKWKGYPDSENSWVKANEFQGQAVILKYWRERAKLERKKKKGEKEERQPLPISTRIVWGSYVRLSHQGYT
jgi:hypothetical protein